MRSNPLSDKTDLRRLLRSRRAALSSAQRRREARALARHLLPRLRAGMRLGIYQAQGAELSLAPLQALAAQRGVQLYLPVVPPAIRHTSAASCASSRRMHFVRLGQARGYWRRNALGIWEYRGTHTTATRLDWVLLPLVGFDDQGGRLGQGGGYYDASFAFRSRRPFRSPRLIGVAYVCQQISTVPRELHDLPLDAILTAHGWIHPRRRQAPSISKKCYSGKDL